MAAKRISRSAIDWAAFAERVPPSQKQNFLSFKSKSDTYLRKVLGYPETAPAIDWQFYKSKIAIPGLVDEFQKQYSAISIPYPKDTQSSLVDQQKKEAEQEIAKFCADSDKRIEEYKAQLAILDAMLPVEEMTLEEYFTAFPEQGFNPDKPTFWPHDEIPPEGFIAPKEPADAAH